MAFREGGLGWRRGRIGLALVGVDLVGPAYQVGLGVRDEELGVLRRCPYRPGSRASHPGRSTCRTCGLRVRGLSHGVPL